MKNKVLKLLSAFLSLMVLGASALEAQDFNLSGISAADIKATSADLKVPAVAEISAVTPAYAGLLAAGSCGTQACAVRKTLDSIESGVTQGTRNEMNMLFELRRELGRSGADSSMSATDMRELISRARHLQDDIAVSLMAGGGLNSGEPFKGELSVQKAADFRFPDDLMIGDIMLSRGTNMMGSLAARMSETPGEYSHLGVVYRDTETRGLVILASDSGVGATVEPIEKFLAGRVRLMVMRYKDAGPAEKAAQLMRARLEKNVPYDYSLNSDDDSALYCTEIAATGFKMAGQIKVPLQMSRLPGAGRSAMYSNIGIAGPSVFLPQDLEVDPRFEVMTEWTDYSKISELNEVDAVYGKMAQWMDRENYVFTKNILNQGIGRILATLAGKKIRDTVGGLGGSVITNGFDYGLTLYQFVTLLRAKMDESIKNKTGYRSLADMNKILEDIRVEEYRQYKDAFLYGGGENASSVNMHSYFKPRRM
ncbi:MAG: hypothetical protein HY796_12795 [Elusimicrobia bacterium]|nr:hypothetical protein [Elusimicrobiota bacterium]